jgi:BirA family biotin operon repressor/biotin-[acetyl-CoA-carboxylase] ligase
VGVAVAQGLNTLLGTRGAEAAVRLKWPNDLWLGEAKLAGILVEAAHVGGRRHAVVGVGINIRPPRWTSASPPAPLPSTPVAGAPLALPPMPPAHLQAVCPDVDAADALHAVAPPLLEALLTFEQHGFAPFQSAFAALDALRGRAVVLSDGMCGVAEGVNAVGECLVRTEQGVQAVASAELSVRPARLLGPTGAQAC